MTTQEVKNLENEDRRIWVEMSKMEGRVRTIAENDCKRLNEKIEDHTKNNDDNMSEFKKKVDILSCDVSEVKQSLSEVKTDVAWLKQNHWIIVGASVGALITAIINVIIK